MVEAYTLQAAGCQIVGKRQALSPSGTTCCASYQLACLPKTELVAYRIGGPRRPSHEAMGHSHLPDAKAVSGPKTKKVLCLTTLHNVGRVGAAENLDPRPRAGAFHAFHRKLCGSCCFVLPPSCYPASHSYYPQLFCRNGSALQKSATSLCVPWIHFRVHLFHLVSSPTFHLCHVPPTTGARCLCFSLCNPCFSRASVIFRLCLLFSLVFPLSMPRFRVQPLVSPLCCLCEIQLPFAPFPQGFPTRLGWL